MRRNRCARGWRKLLAAVAGAATRLGGAALAGAAAAQTATDLPIRVRGRRRCPSGGAPPKSPPPAPPPPEDGLGQNGFYLEADSLTRDDRNNVWTAEGEVEARYQGRVVRADKLVYDVATGSVTVDGHAQIISPDGTAVSGDHVVLDDKMRAGFVRGFGAHEQQNITLGADLAVRRSATVTELDRAIFTPCDVCDPKDGRPRSRPGRSRPPKSSRIATKHLIFYRNAVLRVKGIPILYAPVFWHPDPTAPRASGFLVPRVELNHKLGLAYQQPYLQVISPSQELIISPEINTNVNPFLNLEWLERFYSGNIDARAGYTYERDFDANGHKFGTDQSRAYVLANGAFDLDSNWKWGFSAERASDPLLFDKYDVTNVYSNRGLFQDDSLRLTSQIYATRQDAQSYLSISAMSFQGLRQLGFNVTEDNRRFPIVAPLIEWRYDPNIDILGGRLRLTGGGVVLTRNEQLIDSHRPDRRQPPGQRSRPTGCAP